MFYTTISTPETNNRTIRLEVSDLRPCLGGKFEKLLHSGSENVLDTVNRFLKKSFRNKVVKIEVIIDDDDSSDENPQHEVIYDTPKFVAGKGQNKMYSVSKYKKNGSIKLINLVPAKKINFATFVPAQSAKTENSDAEKRERSTTEILAELILNGKLSEVHDYLGITGKESEESFGKMVKMLEAEDLNEGKNLEYCKRKRTTRVYECNKNELEDIEEAL